MWQTKIAPPHLEPNNRSQCATEDIYVCNKGGYNVWLF